MVRFKFHSLIVWEFSLPPRAKFRAWGLIKVLA